MKHNLTVILNEESMDIIKEKMEKSLLSRSQIINQLISGNYKIDEDKPIEEVNFDYNELSTSEQNKFLTDNFKSNVREQRVLSRDDVKTYILNALNLVDPNDSVYEVINEFVNSYDFTDRLKFDEFLINLAKFDKVQFMALPDKLTNAFESVQPIEFILPSEEAVLSTTIITKSNDVEFFDKQTEIDVSELPELPKEEEAIYNPSISESYKELEKEYVNNLRNVTPFEISTGEADFYLRVLHFINARKGNNNI